MSVSVVYSLPSDLKVGICEYLKKPIGDTEEPFSIKTIPRAPDAGLEFSINWTGSLEPLSALFALVVPESRTTKVTKRLMTFLIEKLYLSSSSY
jgi:hypothetical protein